MKNTFILALLSISLSSFTAQSSELFIEENLTKETPKMIANTMKDIPEEDRAAELDALAQGMIKFSEGSFYDALPYFKKALGHYGSPLGYFYASFIETDRQTKVRYLFIAQNAENSGALPKGTLYKHYTWVQGFLANN